MILGNEKVDLVDSFAYQNSIISDGGYREDFKRIIAKAQGTFS